MIAVIDDHPRQCVFAGSTNQDDYLRDETGGRRFWPVRCGARIDLAGIERDRAQLWAEAVARYEAGECWWLDTLELNREAEVEQAARYTGDPWKRLAAEYLVDRENDGASVAEFLEHIGLKTVERDQRAANRAARIFRSLKWERRRIGPRDAREYRYFPAVSQYETPCPTMEGHTGTRKNPEKSIPYPSVPVSPTCSETFSGEKPKKPQTAPETAPRTGFSRFALGKGEEELGHTGTQGYSLETEGENRVPLGEAHTGTPGATGTPGNGADALEAALEQLRAMGFGRAAPDEEEHDADAEERAGIQEYDGGGATGPVLEVYEI